jgi:hypothetical protein
MKEGRIRGALSLRFTPRGGAVKLPGMPPRRSALSRTGLAAAVAVLALHGALGGCNRTAENTPESVADSFVDAYFRQMDQERAKAFTALGATRMLEQELREVQEVRKDGYEPGSVAVSAHRGESAPRDERIRIPYEIEIQTEAGKQLRDADVELTRIEGQWKVVRVGVAHREPAKTP